MRSDFDKSTSKEVFLDYVISRVNQKGLNLFLGAGISKDPPSNLPLAEEFRTYIFKKLCASEELSGVYGFANKLGEIPFEKFIQIIVHGSNFFDVLLRIFKSGKPNKTHKLFAKLLKKGYLFRILTTNFDTMLEQALRLERVNQTDVDILFNEAQFAKRDINSLKRPVICKIHGSVEAPESIRATLDMIARKALQEARVKILDYFFKKCDADLLVLGYSCSDEFDINPFLRQLKSKTKIFIVKHDAVRFSIQKLEDPFQAFPGNQIICNTREIINRLWNEFMNAKFEEKNTVNENWMEKVDRWVSSLSIAQKCYLIGELLFEIGEPDHAISLFRKGIKRSSDAGQTALILHRLATIHTMKGEFEEATNLYQKSLPSFKKRKDYIKTAATYHFLGMIEKRKGKYQNAEKLLRKSLEICRNINYLFGMGVASAEIATIYQRRGDFERAKELLKESLNVHRKIGHLTGIAMCLHQLGIIERVKGNNTEAEKLFQESLKIRRKIGYKRGIAASLHELALVATHRKKLDIAEKLFKESLQVTRKLGDRAGVSWTLHDLASVFLLRKDYSKAEELYQKSLRIKRSINDQRGIAASLCQLGTIRMYENKHSEAKALLDEAYKICRKLKDKHGTMIVLRNLEQLYLKMCDFKKVVELRKKMMQLD